MRAWSFVVPALLLAGCAAPRYASWPSTTPPPLVRHGPAGFGTTRGPLLTQTQQPRSCDDGSAEVREVCHVEQLKNYRGHPQDLLRADPHEAALYCKKIAESNDAQFCAYVSQSFPGIQQQLLAEDTEKAQRAAKQAQEQEARAEQPRPALTRGIGIVPGAIICPDLQTVSVAIDWYTEAATDAFQDQVTNGESILLRGRTPAPRLHAMGCEFAPAGTRVTVRRLHAIPIVSGQLPDGRPLSGVTEPSMVADIGAP